jgi:5-methylcytosine-specific restriction endonuclease McrA
MTTEEESPFFRFAYKPDVPVDAPKYAKLFIRTAQLMSVPIRKEEKKEKDKEKEKEKKTKTKKKHIPSTIKRLVWNSHIGEEIGKAKCLCCKITDITQLSFNCGHIIAESNGGQIIVSNLKPICQNCNSSMGTRNMNEFMRTLL